MGNLLHYVETVMGARWGKLERSAAKQGNNQIVDGANGNCATIRENGRKVGVLRLQFV